jgi:Cft2 family RNA processing exonuclease
MSSIRYYSGGGANAIGNSFSMLAFDNKYYLGMDWGGGYGPISQEPQYSGPLDCLFISHAHLDHCIQVPRLKKRRSSVKIFATKPTIDLCHIGWKQTLYLAEKNNVRPPFLEGDVEKTVKSIGTVEFDQEVRLTDEISVFPLNAGHILGSICLLVTYKKEAFFLTSDICFQDRHLIQGATKISLEKSRLLVRESTYINKPFENRDNVISEFVKSAKEVMRKGGRVIVPALSIDRTQDIVAVAAEAGIFPLYIDGSRETTEAYIKHLGPLASSLGRAKRFADQREREEFLNSRKPAMIVASSGMVYAGTLSSFWVKNVLPNQKDAVFLVNYQDPDGQGSIISRTGQGEFCVINGMISKRACDVRKFNFSAHMSGEDGMALEERLNPKTVIYNHGQNGEIDRFIADAPNDGRRRIKAEVGKWVIV